MNQEHITVPVDVPDNSIHSTGVKTEATKGTGSYSIVTTLVLMILAYFLGYVLSQNPCPKVCH